MPRAAMNNEEAGRAVAAMKRRRRFMYDELVRQCTAAGVRVEDVVGFRKHKRVAFVRRHFWLWVRAQGWSYPEIGLLFGCHHTSIIIGVRKATMEAAHEATSVE